MDMVEKLVAEDDSIKGIWCVPMYSNPSGVTYSDEVVRRMAALKPAAEDFRIFWDNAYCIHHLTDTPDTLLNLYDELKKNGNEDMAYMFASTSKVTFPGSGVAIMASSEKNLAFVKSTMTIQTIGHDKLNMLRHVKFFGNFDNVKAHMEKHRAILEPKFKIVTETLEKEIAPLGIGSWVNPNGGYFVSFDSMSGCAKRIVQLCKEAGVVMTGAGATFPYGKDPEDKNIRIAPTFPDSDELRKAMEIFVCAVKLAAAEKLMK
jgi:DNA-binding transcriptional MocR family regulator